jgi:hypothetical protein
MKDALSKIPFEAWLNNQLEAPDIRKFREWRKTSIAAQIQNGEGPNELVKTLAYNIASIRLGVSFKSWNSKDEDFERKETVEWWVDEEFDELFILHKLSGHLINEELNERMRFGTNFSFSGHCHWNKMSSQRMMLRVAETLESRN